MIRIGVHVTAGRTRTERCENKHKLSYPRLPPSYHHHRLCDSSRLNPLIALLKLAKEISLPILAGSQPGI